MGKNIDEEINETINITYSLCYNYMLNCQTYAQQMNYIYLKDCDNFYIDNTSMNNQVNVSTSCAQINSANTQLDLDVNLTDQAVQLANSIEESFDDYVDSYECPSSSGYESYVTSTSCNMTFILNLCLNLVYSLKEAFTTDCSLNVDSKSIISCQDSDNNTYNNLDFTQYVDSTSSCIQNNGQVTDAYNALMDFVSQDSGDDDNNDYLIIISILSVIYIAVLLTYFYKSFKSLNNICTYLLIPIIILGVYIVVAYENNYAPFDNDNNLDYSYDTVYTDNDKLLFAMTVILFVLGSIVLIVSAYAHQIQSQNKDKNLHMIKPQLFWNKKI